MIDCQTSFQLGVKLDLDYFLSLSSLEAESFLSKQVRIAYDLKESQIELIEDGLMRELERWL